MGSKKPYTPQADVADMQRVFDQPVRVTPTVPPANERLLAARLILEEAIETVVKGLGVSITLHDAFVVNTLNDLVLTPDLEPDIVQIADGLGDNLVVNYWTFNLCGFDAQKIFDEVHRSNMSKIWEDGQIRKSEFGKVIKPPTYSPANIAGVLAQHSAEADSTSIQ